MNDETVVRTAAVVAAIALLAAPYWDVIARGLSEAAKAAGLSRTHAAWAAAVIVLIAAFGGVVAERVQSVRLPSMAGLLAIARVAVGCCSIGLAAAAFWRRKDADDIRSAIGMLLLSSGLLMFGCDQHLPLVDIEWKPSPVRPVDLKATSAVYVYEKNDGPVPPAVTAAIDKINREKKVLASLFEDDTTDGSGDVPDQYKPALEAAKKASIPAFVVLSGTTAVAVVASPKSIEEMMRLFP